MYIPMKLRQSAWRLGGEHCMLQLQCSNVGYLWNVWGLVPGSCGEALVY
jgi:hypothetical protein